MSNPLLTRRFRNRLSFQVAFLVIACAMLLTLLAAMIQLYFSYRNEISKIYSTIHFIQESYLQPVTRSLYRVDEQQLRLQLQGILKLKNISYVEVVETRGSQKFEMIEGDPGSKRHIIQSFALEIQRPDGKTMKIGQLTVAANFNDLYNDLWDNFTNILLSTTVQMFFLVLVILFIIQRLITRHLMMLTRYTETINFEKDGIPPVMDRTWTKSFPNEIDYVANAINDLQSRIRKHMGERERAESALQVAHDELEQRVRNRTMELEAINQQLQMEIDGRKSADTALRESREKYSSLFHMNPAGVAVTTMAESRFLEINETFCRIVGYSRKELLGRTTEELKFWKDPIEIDKIVTPASHERGFHEKEVICVKKDGNMVDILWSASVTHLGGETCFINTFIDVTESKRLRQERSELESHLRQAQKMVKNSTRLYLAFD